MLALSAALVLAGAPSGAAAAAGLPADGPDGPVADAIADPSSLDSPAEVRDLARETRGDPGTPVGVVLDRNGEEPGGISVVRIQSPPQQADALAAQLAAVAGVESAAPAERVQLLADPLSSSQYGPTRIGATTLPAGLDGRGTTVAVVDTGVSGTHADLTPPLPDGRPRVAAGTSFLYGDAANGTPGNVDPHGHGTHVAGIVAAARDNGLGGAGVAPGAQILPVRVLSATGSGWSTDVVAGILWAHQAGADVINLSLGGPGNVPGDMAAALDRVTTDTSRGKAPSVVVAAAGNSGAGGEANWPGRSPRAIAVAATDPADNVAGFSTRGSYVSVAAPGVSILSTCRSGGYCTMSGTSMATPMVAGAAAVLRQQQPSRTTEQVRAQLEGTARDVSVPGRDVDSGAGRIDLAAATAAPQLAVNTPPAPPAPAVMAGGSLDVVLLDRRRILMNGRAFDPDGVPRVKVIDAANGVLSSIEFNGDGAGWGAAIDVGPGNHLTCAWAVDQPTGQQVLLGCRGVLVK